MGAVEGKRVSLEDGGEAKAEGVGIDIAGKAISGDWLELRWGDAAEARLDGDAALGSE